MSEEKTYAHMISVTLRGRWFDVRFEDRGYESDTNAHMIDWYFDDGEDRKLELTDEEEQLVFNQLYEYCADFGS